MTESATTATAPAKGLNGISAFFIAAAIALIALIAISKGHVNDTAYGDGLIYRYVASHLTTPLHLIDPVVSGRGISLRYGRIGFPALIWLTAAGHNSVMPWSQAAIIIVFSGAAGAATAKLFPAAGPIGALLPFIAPGFSLSVVGGYAEVLTVALGLWAVILASRGRWWPAAGLLSFAMFVREDAGAVLVGLVLWELVKRRPKAALILAASLVPMVGWYAFAKVHYGHIPLFDPYLQVGTRTPFVALWKSLTLGTTQSNVTAAVHTGLAVIAFWMWRRSILGAVAAAAGLQVLVSGVLAWQYIGDAMRVFVFLELFVLMLLLRYRWPAPRSSGTETYSLEAETTPAS